MKLKNYDLIKGNFDVISKSKNISNKQVNETLRTVENSILNHFVKLKAKHKITLDKETECHSIAVAKLALFTGLALKMTEEELSNIVVGALIHDIGKFFTPKEILQKPAKLTNEEMDIMKEHPLLGYKFVNRLKLSEDIKLMILDHHEKIDGTGYPANKKASEINYYAKIVTVCDVFEAFSSKRCYKDEVDLHVVMNFLLDQRGIQFDTDIVNIFHNSVYSVMDIRKILSAVNHEEINLVNKSKFKLKPILNYNIN